MYLLWSSVICLKRKNIHLLIHILRTTVINQSQFSENFSKLKSTDSFCENSVYQIVIIKVYVIYDLDSYYLWNKCEKPVTYFFGVKKKNKQCYIYKLSVYLMWIKEQKIFNNLIIKENIHSSKLLLIITNLLEVWKLS